MMPWLVVFLGCSKSPKVPDYVVDGAQRMEHIASAYVQPTEDEIELPQVPEGPALPDVVETIAFGSCLQQDKEAPVLATLAESGADLLVLLGDNVYGDSKPSDPWLTELREAYWTLARREDFGALVAKVPLLATWDDHDYGVNDGGARFSGKSYAERIFDHFWRVPEGSPRDVREGVYDAVTFGEGDQRVQVLLLDLRTFKSDFEPTPTRNEPGAERYVPTDDPSRTMLGDAQWDWLQSQLEESARLRIVVSSLQVHADGHGWERWGLFPAERDRLYGMLAEREGGSVVIVSGDRHRAGIYERPDLRGGPYPEMTTSSLNLSFGGDEEAGPHRVGPTYTAENYGTLLIDWDGESASLAVRDVGGEAVLTHGVALP